MKKILLSLSMIAVVGVVVAGATGAFFSDTETSTGNTFTAGEINLTVDNASYRSDDEGDMIFSQSTSWDFIDLTNELFFNFEDLKPGDIGEDTISLHVTSNDAWACMNIDITDTPENNVTEPEDDLGDEGPDGELQNYLKFVFWADDGDNVYEQGENIFWEGVAGEIFDGSWVTLADSNDTVFGDEENSYPLADNETYYVAKAWCFGDINPLGLPNDSAFPPNIRGSGFTCDGTSTSNWSQTDGVLADVSFEAVQTRNNPDFLCEDFNQS